MTANKVGIFGGTFNPVHIAHREAALCFRDRMALDLLYIIPNRLPPLKKSGNVSGEDRLNMLRIAFDGCERTLVSDMELKRSGTSYTCDTLREIKAIHPGAELFLLTGDDWLGSFDRWKDFRYILDNATLVVADRSGRDISADAERLYSLCGKRPILLGNKRIPLSSTGIREAPKREDLPEGVFDYIAERGLYGT